MKRLVHGTPITPKRLLPQLKGKSFCVSYMHPEQLNETIELVGDNEVLILDNGAFTAWKKGITLDDAWWDGFYAWANAAMDKCPNAVCVIPDVINGNEADNLQLIADAIKGNKIKYPERAMAIWHIDKPWIHMMRGLGVLHKIGFDSADSCNIAMNHWRNKNNVVHHVAQFADRLEAKVNNQELNELPLFNVAA